jgi:hypothetical protein
MTHSRPRSTSSTILVTGPTGKVGRLLALEKGLRDAATTTHGVTNRE